MKVIEGHPTFQPGCCMICKSGAKRVYVDTEADTLDGFDRIYICSVCAMEIAGLFNMVTEEEYAELKEKYEKLAKFYDETRRLHDSVTAVSYMLLKQFTESADKHSIHYPEELISIVQEFSKKRREGSRKMKEALIVEALASAVAAAAAALIAVKAVGLLKEASEVLKKHEEPTNLTSYFEDLYNDYIHPEEAGD